MAVEFPCIESMMEFEVDPFKVRVWRDADSLEAAEEGDCIDIMECIEEGVRYHWSQTQLTRRLCSLPKINAVHVSIGGQGIVAYVSWP